MLAPLPAVPVTPLSCNSLAYGVLRELMSTAGRPCHPGNGRARAPVGPKEYQVWQKGWYSLGPGA